MLSIQSQVKEILEESWYNAWIPKIFKLDRGWIYTKVSLYSNMLHFWKLSLVMTHIWDEGSMLSISTEAGVICNIWGANNQLLSLHKCLIDTYWMSTSVYKLLEFPNSDHTQCWLISLIYKNQTCWSISALSWVCALRQLLKKMMAWHGMTNKQSLLVVYVEERKIET